MDKTPNVKAQANLNFDCKSTSNYTETADMTPKNDYQYDRKCKCDERKTALKCAFGALLTFAIGVVSYKYIDCRYSAQPVKA